MSSTLLHYVPEIAVGLIVAGLTGGGVFLKTRAKRRLDSQRPLIISAEQVIREPWAVVFPGSLPDPSEIEGMSRPSSEVFKWLRDHGGADQGDTRVRLRVEGVSDRVVLIREIRVEAEREQPFAGTRVYCPTAGANAATLLVFDLDDPHPVAWEWNEDGGRERTGSRPYFDTHNVTVKKNEICDFVIVTAAELVRCRWTIAVDLSVGRRRQTLRINDHGQPFHTSGEPAGGFMERLDWAWYDGFKFRPEAT